MKFLWLMLLVKDILCLYTHKSLLKGLTDNNLLAVQHLQEYIRIDSSKTENYDEEVGGFRGIKAFIESGDFKRLNVGFVLDEGLTAPDNTYLATYLDRRPWQINMTFYGQGGHGSEIADKGVIKKLDYILKYTLQYQKEQKEVMARGNNAWLGRFTTMNINIIKTGIATNIMPSLVNVVIDMRLATDVSISDIQQMIDTWQNVTGPGTTVEFLRRDEVSPATTLANNCYWNAMLEAAAELNITIKPVVLAATSDMVVVRKLGIPAIGFNPSINTISRVHNNDEYVNIETFIQGIQVVKNIVMKLSNVLE
ncbi:aminoacylase-1A-like isoform X2 [Pieris brassicae]|uniref:aminoacylase-1A-like isoform X2 n=1 Tax=Pieris brassicae TaxID=7116 RepID=UPI001E661C64|nr:aminoacylase-1A-like isoform X2 [Pieris brassicae]